MIALSGGVCCLIYMQEGADSTCQVSPSWDPEHQKW